MPEAQVIFLDGPAAGSAARIPAVVKSARELPTVDEFITVPSPEGPVRYRRHFVTAKANGQIVAMFLYQPQV